MTHFNFITILNFNFDTFQHARNVAKFCNFSIKICFSFLLNKSVSPTKSSKWYHNFKFVNIQRLSSKFFLIFASKKCIFRQRVGVSIWPRPYKSNLNFVKFTPFLLLFLFTFKIFLFIFYYYYFILFLFLLFFYICFLLSYLTHS